jgi:hypothetical protein
MGRCTRSNKQGTPHCAGDAEPRTLAWTIQHVAAIAAFASAVEGNTVSRGVRITPRDCSGYVDARSAALMRHVNITNNRNMIVYQERVGLCPTPTTGGSAVRPNANDSTQSNPLGLLRGVIGTADLAKLMGASAAMSEGQAIDAAFSRRPPNALAHDHGSFSGYLVIANDLRATPHSGTCVRLGHAQASQLDERFKFRKHVGLRVVVLLIVTLVFISVVIVVVGPAYHRSSSA